MSPQERRLFAATLATLATLSVCALASPARADDLHVTTLAGGSWAATVAQLESDVHGEGRVVSLVVADEFLRRVPCGRYRILLDAVSARAFVIGTCDPETQATPVTLVRRAALFDARDPLLPVPLVAGITAVEMLSGGERGGAGISGGSTLHCTIDVRPYVMDLLHGTRVYLPPGRYVLRPLNSSVTAVARVDGWTLTTASAGVLTVEYDVVDTQRNVVVVHDRATLSCGNAPAPTYVPGTAPGGAPRATSSAAMPSVAPVRSAAEVDGRGLPISTFDDVLPRDGTVEQPSPWVRSRVTTP